MHDNERRYTAVSGQNSDDEIKENVHPWFSEVFETVNPIPKLVPTYGNCMDIVWKRRFRCIKIIKTK